MIKKLLSSVALGLFCVNSFALDGAIFYNIHQKQYGHNPSATSFYIENYTNNVVTDVYFTRFDGHQGVYTVYPDEGIGIDTCYANGNVCDPYFTISIVDHYTGQSYTPADPRAFADDEFDIRAYNKQSHQDIKIVKHKK